MSLAELKTLADDYEGSCAEKSDNAIAKEILDALVDALTKAKAEVAALKARVKALEDA